MGTRITCGERCIPRLLACPHLHLHFPLLAPTQRKSTHDRPPPRSSQRLVEAQPGQHPSRFLFSAYRVDARHQVFLIVFFWLWRISNGAPDGPRIFYIRRINRFLSQSPHRSPQPPRTARTHPPFVLQNGTRRGRLLYQPSQLFMAQDISTAFSVLVVSSLLLLLSRPQLIIASPRTARSTGGSCPLPRVTLPH